MEGLRKQGLGDMGMLYLRKLETEQKIPASLVETFDLELARCMQVAAQRSENVDEAERLRVETRGQLEKFLKDHATHPQAGFAFDTYGVLSLSIGNTSLKQASFQKDPKRKELLLTQARAAFEEARPRFAEAAKLFKNRYDELAQSAEELGEEKSAKARLSKKRQAQQLALAEDDWLNSRFNLSMVDYHVAQTYADPQHADVKPLLEKADKSLDAIWQGYRGLLPGLLAHYWTGRVNELLGNFDKALDIYDEVTGNEAEEGRALNPALAGFYAENFLQRARLLNQLNRRAGDFANDTPYNSYTRKGLPPTPIGNPGAAALEAILKADRTAADGKPWLYFVHGLKGEFRPNTDFQSHLRDVEKYR